MFIEDVRCPLCNNSGATRLGARGNREYLGADKNTVPHLVTSVLRCAFCEFIFCHPYIPGMEELERSHYDKIPSVIHSELIEDAQSFTKGFEVISQYKNCVSLLDVGAGKGVALHLATELGFDTTGVEPSLNSCQYALKHFGLSIYNGYIQENFPAPGRRYQVVTMFHVLEHMEDPRGVLRILKNRLAEEGIIYIEVPNGNATFLKLADALLALTGRPWSTRLSPLHPPFHRVAYSTRSLYFLLESEGFEVFDSGTFSSPSRCRLGMTTKTKAIVQLRDILSWCFSFLPNREIVYMLAKVRT